MEEVILPTRVAWALGVRAAILTNAAGGINGRYQVRLFPDWFRVWFRVGSRQHQWPVPRAPHPCRAQL